jgi:hypothetical protein
MLSDILVKARAAIMDDLAKNPPDAALEGRITAWLTEMEAIRVELDKPPSRNEGTPEEIASNVRPDAAAIPRNP